VLKDHKEILVIPHKVPKDHKVIHRKESKETLVTHHKGEVVKKG
jgi:hypothetical protein